MIGFTIPFYRDLIEIARRPPSNDRIEVDVTELEWLLDWASAGLASGIEAPSGGETTKIGSTEGESPTRKGDAQSQPLGNPLDTGDGK